MDGTVQRNFSLFIVVVGGGGGGGGGGVGSGMAVAAAVAAGWLFLTSSSHRKLRFMTRETKAMLATPTTSFSV